MTSWAMPDSQRRSASLRASLRVWERDDRRLREAELREIAFDLDALRARTLSLYRELQDVEPSPREPEAVQRLARLAGAASLMHDALACLRAAQKPSRGASSAREARPGSDERSLDGDQDTRQA